MCEVSVTTENYKVPISPTHILELLSELQMTLTTSWNQDSLKEHCQLVLFLTVSPKIKLTPATMAEYVCCLTWPETSLLFLETQFPTTL